MQSPQEYAQAGGYRCPVCTSSHLDCKRVEIFAAGAYQGIICNCCGAEWTDSYLLTGYINLEKRDGPVR